MQLVLIDTDVLINYMRGGVGACNFIGEILDNDCACVSPVTIYEVYAGMRPSEKEKTDAMISSMHLIDLTANIAKVAGSRWCKYRQHGITLSGTDCMIAATAITNNCQLLTHNVKHFPDVELFGIKK
jgi:predicted nucleic acid-binding protein